MGMFVMGSTISPLMVISISMRLLSHAKTSDAPYGRARLARRRLSGPARVIRTGTVRPIHVPRVRVHPLSSVGTGKLTTVFPLVRPETSCISRRLAESTSTSSIAPTASSFSWV